MIFCKTQQFCHLGNSERHHRHRPQEIQPPEYDDVDSAIQGSMIDDSG